MADQKQVFQNIKMIVKPFLNLMVSIEKKGLQHIPDSGGTILVGNHRSDMDPFIVASVVPRYISWIAAEYTQRIPIFKNLIRETGVIPMDISGNVSVSSIKKLMSVLRSGEILGIFPEGHDYMVQNDFSAPMVSFHSGFAIFAYRARVPVVPFSIIPIEEEIEAMPVPQQLRQLMGLPEEVSAIPQRANYKKVKVVFGPGLQPEEFKEMKEKEALQHIQQKIRNSMLSIQMQEGLLTANEDLLQTTS
ncbi:MAG: 1-acyl-sn-glycerol-3-phosphate acyltransferase [Spirochaetaceae bacterium]|nr:1-acyl-sn-glycerol-3-phosphate acyltransferase [Spirochaetaceae bacterium]|tara:strand:- start:38901 stop:39641 length:741 start_codon:yes stop_codon:yes gene_type:complete